MEYMNLNGTTFATGKAGLAAGTTTTSTIANQTDYCIDGKAFRKATASNAATPTADAVTGAAFPAISANQGTVVVYGLDASGAIKCAQGTIEPLDVQGNFTKQPNFPTTISTVCPIGYLVLKGGATLVGTFTFGTNNLSGVTGMTYSFTDVLVLPSRPQA